MQTLQRLKVGSWRKEAKKGGNLESEKRTAETSRPPLFKALDQKLLLNIPLGSQP